MKKLDEVPTADVVPKSEVERLQKERVEYKKHVDNDIIYVHRIKAEVAMEIFEELERTVMHPNWASQNYKNWYFAELKKKYAEEQT